MEITENQNKAVNDIIEMVVSVLGKGSRELDTFFAISSTARLAGSFLFRSFGLTMDNIAPGTAVLSENANVKGPELVNLTFAVLQSYGIEINNDKMSNSPSNKAETSFIETMNILQTPAIEIMKKNELTFEEMAQSAAIATAFIIQQSSNISPEDGFGTAIYYYIEGSKTWPPSLSDTSNLTKEETSFEQKPANTNVPKPWWKFW